ncbi:hypothetical protein PSP6_740116 [Paraburkholderia tropica]|nr:hypothetical protein PSP6_740116 [Paraburkholderia tropica]
MPFKSWLKNRPAGFSSRASRCAVSDSELRRRRILVTQMTYCKRFLTQAPRFMQRSNARHIRPPLLNL